MTLSVWHASRFGFRALVLMQVALMAFSANFMYDGPAALDLGISPSQLGIIFSAYSIPNLIMPLVAGILTHRLGVNQASLFFAISYLIGGIIFGSSSWTKDVAGFWLRTIGRVVSGIGGEALSLARTVIISSWFEGKELAMAFGIAMTFSRLGSIFAFWVLPFLQEEYGLTVAQIAMVNMVWLMIFTVLAIWVLDIRGKKQLAELQASETVELIPLDTNPDNQKLDQNGSYHDNHSINRNREKSSLIDEPKVNSLPNQIGKNEGPSSVVALDSSIEPSVVALDSSTELELISPINKQIENNGEDQAPSGTLTLLKEISLGFWLLNLTSITYYLTILPALSFIPSFLKDFRHVSLGNANQIASLSRWGAMIFSIFSGFIIDKVGYRGHILFFSFSLMVPGFLLFMVQSIPPAFIGLIITPTFTITPAVLWPCFTLVSPPRVRALSLGIAFCSLNFGSTVGPVLFGVLRDATASWSAGLVLFAFIVLVGCISTLFLLHQDSTKLHHILKLRNSSSLSKHE